MADAEAIKREEDIRKKVHLYKEHIEHTSSTEYPNVYPSVVENEYSFDLTKFKEDLQIVVTKLEGTDLEFDLIGIDASVANAFRRIMISEVPTMAIENCFIEMNTSIMYDEILAQRLGLIPLGVNPDLFSFMDSSETTDRNTLVFKLDVKCTKKKNPPLTSNDDEKYNNVKVMSADIKWEPQGDQKDRIDGDIKPIHADIEIARLRPGDSISGIFHARKGVGQDHAKWSPVATASYRLLPEIEILKPIPQPLQEKFQKCFAPGVIDIVTDKLGDSRVVVANARKDTVSREVLRHSEFEGMVKLNRIRDHFLYLVESVGAIPPNEIFENSCDVLFSKCDQLKRAMHASGLVRSSDE